jgi:hypothetical protein
MRRSCLWIIVFPDNAIDIFRTFMKFIVRKFSAKILMDEEHAGDAQRKPQNVNETVIFVLEQIAKRDL